MASGQENMAVASVCFAGWESFPWLLGLVMSELPWLWMRSRSSRVKGSSLFFAVRVWALGLGSAHTQRTNLQTRNL